MNKQLSLITLLILGILTRFLPHPANFTAIGAIAMFGGLYLPRRWSIVGPMLAMLASDVFIGFYSLPIMISVYISFALMGVIGLMARRNKNIFTVAGGTIFGSLIFYTLTNFAVWAFGTMYPHTIAGLLQSYWMAFPFLRNSLVGDIFFIAILAGGYEAILWYRHRLVARA